MADDKKAVTPVVEGEVRDAEFLHGEFEVRPDKAAALTTDNKGDAERTETAVRQANKGSGAVPGATSPEASSGEAATDTDEDYSKPVINADNDHAGPG